MPRIFAIFCSLAMIAPTGDTYAAPPAEPLKKPPEAKPLRPPAPRDGTIDPFAPGSTKRSAPPIRGSAKDSKNAPKKDTPKKDSQNEPEKELSPAEMAQCRKDLARLLADLDAEAYEIRERAAEQLQKMVGRPELGPLLSNEFNKLLVDPKVSFEVQWRVKRWVVALPKATPAVPKSISEEELDKVLKQLDDDSYAVRQGAARRLEWLASQDVSLARVKRAIELRLKETPDTEIANHLRKLLELMRPAMVAEFWQGRRHLGEQHLLVDVPSLAEGAVRPSHFDRIDDKTAHCVSGNSLSPGNYPVGVAFPHPMTEDAFFQLVNLPTPRRRIAYKSEVQRPRDERLAEISKRTLDRLLELKRSLTESELNMMGQLDRKEVSRFANKFLVLIEDELLPASGRARFGGRPSRHGMLCGWLAREGTNDCIPGLIRAIDETRFRPPNSESRYRLHLIAALAIAQRDPWEEVDDWLARQIENDARLMEDRSAECGATAVGILLRRHRKLPTTFDMQLVPEPLLRSFGINGYRFSTDKGRQKVLDWWNEEDAQKREKLAKKGHAAP